jgi:hypothetical protein
MVDRVLNGRVDNKKPEEQQLYTSISVRAQVIGVDLSNVEQRDKCAKYLTDDKYYSYYTSYKAHSGNEDKVHTALTSNIETNGIINAISSKPVKITLMQELEKKIGVELSNVDSIGAMGRFDEAVELDGHTKQLISRTFRIQTDHVETFKDVYYLLIKMYKHIYGSSIMITGQKTINYIHYVQVVTNKERLDELIYVCGLKSLTIEADKAVTAEKITEALIGVKTAKTTGTDKTAEPVRKTADGKVIKSTKAIRGKKVAKSGDSMNVEIRKVLNKTDDIKVVEPVRRTADGKVIKSTKAIRNTKTSVSVKRII